jgi:MSHA biogenesis protein MshN
MSIINQMLRDLDARGTAASATDLPAAVPLRQASASRQGSRVAMALLVLATAGALVYFGRSGTPKAPQPAVLAQPAVVPALAPTTAAPLAHHAVPAPSAPLPSRSVATPSEIRPSLPQPFQMTRSLQFVVPGSRTAALSPASAEPSVSKKPVELTPETDAQQLFDDAQALRRAGKNDAAIAKYRLALERDPGMRHARVQLAGLLQENGQVEAALQLLKSGYEQQANDSLAIATGRMLAEQGRRDEALNWLERGRAGMRPSDHAMMGALLSQAQRYEDAVKAYQYALAMEPTQGGWSLGLGLALESLGRTVEAQRAYRNALEYGKFKPEVLKFLQQKSGFPG